MTELHQLYLEGPDQAHKWKSATEVQLYQWNEFSQYPLISGGQEVSHLQSVQETKKPNLNFTYQE